MNCIKSGCNLHFVIFSLLFFLSPIIKAQTVNVLYKCPHNDFAIRVADTSYANWLYKDHLLMMHDETKNAIEFVNEYTDDYKNKLSKGLKFLACPKGDLEIYSIDVNEIKFLAGIHFVITHNEKHSDEELLKMVQSN